jgi:ribosomal protein S18 acetylase RimI-like enzyme
MFTIRIMTINDYENVIDLMKRTPGVTFRDADSYEATRRYLERNPELNFIGKVGDETVGCIMSGHDGRRGYLQHLVVAPAHRRQGIANALVECCLARLEALDIAKSHVDVIRTNTDAHAYWERRGWQLRTDIDRYSFIRNGRSNA